ARPYRLRGRLSSDLERTSEALAQGDVDTALGQYRGPVLPDSDPPGVREIGAEVDAHMRETLLQDGTWQQLWRYADLPDFRDDVDVLMTVLRLAPPEAAERDAALLRLEAPGAGGSAPAFAPDRHAAQTQRCPGWRHAHTEMIR